MSAESERLNRFIARCGIASRRAADELIAAGRVAVNGTIVSRLGTGIDPKNDVVCLDGSPIRPRPETVVVLFNKPRGVTSTCSDPNANKTLRPFIDRYGLRLFPVGRLDQDSEGLLLLTNDGALTHRLTHPRHHVEKEYRVSVRGCWNEEVKKCLEMGVQLEDGVTAPARVEDIQTGDDAIRFTMVLREGRNRQIRRMCEALGLTVIRLRRNRVGAIRLSGLKPGESRLLTASEIEALRQSASESKS